VAKQAWDIRLLLDAFENASRHQPFAVYASGPNASLAAVYLLGLSHSDDRLAWALLRGTPLSFAQFTRAGAGPTSDQIRSPTHYIYTAFAALEFADIPEILSTFRGRLLLIDPILSTNSSLTQFASTRTITDEDFIRSAW
jgi:hypothetical protein